MISIRQYKSGAEKRKKKLRKEALHKTQVDSLNKYFSSNRLKTSVMNEIENKLQNLIMLVM